MSFVMIGRQSYFFKGAFVIGSIDEVGRHDIAVVGLDTK